MPGPYTIDATDITRPALTDEIQYVAAEITTLKAYLQSQLASFGANANSDYNRVLQNLIINGNFSIFAAGATVPDLWRLNASGTVLTSSITPVGFGAAAPLLDYPTNYINVTSTLDAGVGSFGLIEHRIEDVTTLANNVAAGSLGSLSFLAKANIAANISVDCMQFFGTGGTPSANSAATAGVSKIAITTAWTRYTVPIIPNSLVAKVLGTAGNDYLSIRFWLSAGANYAANTGTLGAQAITLSLAQVQLVPGNISTPYQYRTKAQELQLVSRYLQRIGGEANGGLGIAFADTGVGATGFRATMQLPVKMRTAPGAGVGGTVGTAYSMLGLGAQTIATISPVASSTQNLILTGTTTAAMTAGRTYIMLSNNSTGIITLDARV